MYSLYSGPRNTSAITILQIYGSKLERIENIKTLIKDQVVDQWIKVHLDPPPILVQSSQKLRDNRTKKVKIYFLGKHCLFSSFFRFLDSFYFSALEYFENMPMAGITPGRS